MSIDRQRPRKDRSDRPVRHEWVGGRYRLPFFVKGDTTGSTLRPDVDLWLELPDELLVGTRMIDPDVDAPAAGFVAEILSAPMAGEPRQPDRIRTADATLARELRRRFPQIDVVTAPTPEADAVLEHMLAQFADASEDDASYLQDGALGEADVAAMFDSAFRLYQAAPWERAVDVELMRIDIPALGIDGACAMLCAGDDGRGMLLFRSLSDWESFADAFEARGDDSDALFQPGTSFVALLYHRGADLPTALRREVSTHQWPVADASAFPIVQYNDADNAARPATDREMAVMTASAGALATLFEEHRDALPHLDRPPLCESYSLVDGVDVLVTMPYTYLSRTDDVEDPYGLFEPDTTPARDTVGHQFENLFAAAATDTKRGADGSLWLPTAALERVTADGPMSSEAIEMLQQLDYELLQQISDFALDRFGLDDVRRALRAVSYDSEPSNALIMLSLVYQVEIDGKTPALHYLASHADALPEPAATWLRAQQGSWPSIWQVRTILPAVGITATDQLGGMTVELNDPELADLHDVGDAILGRVLSFQGIPILANEHTVSLPAETAGRIAERVRRYVKRKRRIPLDRLRVPAVSRYLFGRWFEAAEDDLPLNRLR